MQRDGVPSCILGSRPKTSSRSPIARVPPRVAPDKGPVAAACPADDLPQRVSLRCPFWVRLPIGSACRNLREAAPGANQRACINIPGAKGTICAKQCLSYEHSHRRHLLGSGRPWFPQGRNPALSSPVERTGTLPLLRCGALRSFIGGVLPATRSWPISTRRYFRDDRLCFVDCSGSHRADPQSPAPTVDRTRWFDQRVGAEASALSISLSASRLIPARSDGI
jgi:hypothetical protein